MALGAVEVQNLPHADGKAALEAGSVDAWAGLDPLMAASEATAASTVLDPAVARTVVTESTNLEVDPVRADAQRAVLEIVGPIFVESGDVSSQDLIDDALAALLNDTVALASDVSTITD